ncbi:MAG: peptidase, partial [Deltaproteobacteria bacterium]|nr:peptidase [Deltaproteobacteria bacterium]
RLQPANAAMEDIVVPAEDLEIRGVVCGLLRHY